MYCTPVECTVLGYPVPFAYWIENIGYSLSHDFNKQTSTCSSSMYSFIVFQVPGSLNNK